MRSEHVKGTVITKIGPKSFGAFEKQAPVIADTFGNTISYVYQFQLQAREIVPLSLSVHHLFVTLGRVRASLRVTLLGRVRGDTVFVSSRSEVRSLIYDLSCPYFLPQMMMKIKKTVEETLCDDY